MDSKATNSVTAQVKDEDFHPLSQKTMIVYGFGQTGAQLFRDCPAVLLPVFMSTMLGISPWLAGVVVLIPKLWVIICDPVMGALSDQFKPTHSRRPFLVVGAVVTSLSFMGLFAFSGFSEPWIAALTVGILFFVASTAFSSFSVPYLAVASELSEDPHERTKILAYRMIFTVVGVIMGVGLAQPLVFMLGGDAAAWRSMAIIFGSIGLVAMLATAYGVPKNFGTAESTDIKELLSKFSVVKHNRPFIILTITYLIQSIAQGSGYAVVGFIFLYAIGDINMLLPFILVMASGSISSQPMWLKVSRKLGKVKAFWIACVGWILVTLTWLWIGSTNNSQILLPFFGEVATENMLVLVRAFIIGVTNAGFALLTFSMLTDTIASQKDENGNVNEGVFSGIFSATEKLGFALGPLLAGVILSVSNFESSIGGAVEQSGEAILGMILSYSVVPAFAMLISLLIFTQYKKAFKVSS